MLQIQEKTWKKLYVGIYVLAGICVFLVDMFVNYTQGDDMIHKTLALNHDLLYMIKNEGGGGLQSLSPHGFYLDRTYWCGEL